MVNDIYTQKQKSKVYSVPFPDATDDTVDMAFTSSRINGGFYRIVANPEKTIVQFSSEFAAIWFTKHAKLLPAGDNSLNLNS